MRKTAGLISSLRHGNFLETIYKGAKHRFRSLFFLAVLALSVGCAVFQVRPVQEMSDTTVAIRAAKEVQADSLAPELFRQASEWFFKARQEYKLKNFKNAKEYATKARGFAEQSEFEAIRNGGNRTEDTTSDPMAQSQEKIQEKPQERSEEKSQQKSDEKPKQKDGKYIYPTPTGTPADVYDQRRADEEAAKRPPPATTAPATGTKPPGTAPY